MIRSNKRIINRIILLFITFMIGCFANAQSTVEQNLKERCVSGEETHFSARFIASNKGGRVNLLDDQAAQHIIKGDAWVKGVVMIGRAVRATATFSRNSYRLTKSTLTRFRKAPNTGGRVCFVAGTQVYTEDGYKNIEDIEIGDKVWSKADNNKGEQSFKPVITLFRTAPTELVHLTYRTKGYKTHSSQMKASSGDDDDSDSSSSALIGTHEHPFWVVDAQDWVEMGNLKVGDRLVLADGTYAIVENTRVERAKVGEHFTTYNFEVANHHTYYVAPEGETRLQEAVWVHNTGHLCAEGFGNARELFRQGYAKAEVRSMLRNPDFGKHLRRIDGSAPAGMYDPHAHHILFKKGNGVAQQALVAEGQGILRKYGINPIYGKQNLVWAPNRVAGQHGIGALEDVVGALRRADQLGSKSAIEKALRRMGVNAARR